MSIQIMGKSEIEQCKKDIDIDELEILLEDILNQVAVVDMDYLYELKDHVENLIINLEEFELEGDD